MQEPTVDLVRALAAVNGLKIPEERLELVRREYTSLLQTMGRINSLTMPVEIEPAVVFALPFQPALKPEK